MSRTVIAGIACILVLSLSSIAAFPQDDVIEFLRKADEKNYYPQHNGVQSLSADVEFSSTPEMPDLEDISIKTYFKMPDKRATKIDGLPDDPSYKDFRELIESTCKMLVPETLDEQLKEYDFKMEKDGELVKVTQTPKPGTEAAKDYAELITWYSEELLPVRSTVEDPDGQTYDITDFKFKERNGKYFLRSVSASTETETYGTIRARLLFFYKNIEGVWLLSKVKRKIVYEDCGGTEIEFIFEFKNYELNVQIDDEIFTKPEEDEKEEEEEEDTEDEEWQEFDEE